MPSPGKVVIKSYVTPDEYKRVANLATQTHLSISEFIRRVCLGYQPKCQIDQEAVLALIKISADLGRLGGLLKWALAEKSLDWQKGNALLDEIRAAKHQLDEKVKAL